MNFSEPFVRVHQIEIEKSTEGLATSLGGFVWKEKKIGKRRGKNLQLDAPTVVKMQELPYNFALPFHSGAEGSESFLASRMTPFWSKSIMQ